LQIFRGQAILPHMYALRMSVFPLAAFLVSAQTDRWKTDNTLVRVVRSVAPHEFHDPAASVAFEYQPEAPFAPERIEPGPGLEVLRIERKSREEK
jgi:hypothetical protein